MDRFFAPRGHDARLAARWAVIIAVVLGLFSTLVRGYAPGLFNGVVQVPWVRQQLDPSLYPGDLLLLGHANYPSLLWRAVVLLGTIIPFTKVMAAFYVVQQLLLHYAVLRFGWRLSGSSVLGAALASLFALLMVAPGLGGSHWSICLLTHTTFAFPLLIVSLVEALEGRWSRAAAWWIAGSMVHLPNAVFVLPMVGAAAMGVLATQPTLERRWGAFAASATAMAVAFGVLAWWLFSGDNSGPLPTMETLRQQLRNHVGLHLFVSWHLQAPESTKSLLTFLVQTIVAVCMILWAGLDRRVWVPWSCAVVGGALVVVASILTTEVIESVWLARLQRLRAADFLHFVFVMTPLALAGRWAIGQTRLHPLGLAPFVACWFLGSRWWSGSLEWIIAAAVVMMASRMIPATSHILPARWSLGMKPRAVVATSLLVVAWPAMVVSIHYEWLERGWRLEQQTTSAWAREWRDAQEASNRKLPPRQTILTPPHERGWRRNSLHSPFLELSDNIGFVLNPSIGPEYQRRARVLGYDPATMRDWKAEPGALYGGNNAEEFIAVMRSEGLRYAVVPLYLALPGERSLWSGEMIKLVDIGPSPTDDPQTPTTGVSGS